MTTSSLAERIPPSDLEPSGTAELRTCAEAEAYVASICFKHAPPRLVGLELEWLLHHPGATALGPRRLATALTPHAPHSLDPSSPARPLPAGSTVTVEPGGQVELSTLPHPGLGPLLAAADSDAATLHRQLATHGLIPRGRATEPDHPPTRLLHLPRYGAMERHFDRFGPAGRIAMCSTAAVQVCLDAGEAGDVPGRWAALHALGPVLVAAFANSPTLHGRPTGWKSTRTACWLAADPARTAPPPDPAGADPAASWARRVLGSTLLCVRRDGDWDAPVGVTFADWIRGALSGPPPTVADLDYHISTLFPPVRPRGHLEVRYIDAQPGRGWALPVAVLVALTSSPTVVDRVRELCAPARLRWGPAARDGLTDPVLARTATAVFRLACEIVPTLDVPGWVVDDLVTMTERRVARGRCPADEPAAGPVSARADRPQAMSGALDTVRVDVLLSAADSATALRADARAGLTSHPKTLPPKWFYDARGSALFERITELPEYYPTRTERALLAAHAPEIARLAGADTVVELGSGSSEKTRLLLDALSDVGTLRRYLPLDVSEPALRGALAALAREYPGLALHGVVGDFTRHLGRLPRGGRRLVAFLGGTLGNLLPPERAAFFGAVRSALTPGEHLLLGVGLVTDPAVLVPAYDDAAGVTAEFNRNALHVLNRRLGGDFPIDAFGHVARWDAEREWIEMRLRTSRAVTVTLAGLGITVPFAAGEELRTEVSAKFRPDRLLAELATFGFAPVNSWVDQDERFALLLVDAVG